MSLLPSSEEITKVISTAKIAKCYICVLKQKLQLAIRPSITNKRSNEKITV